MGLWGLLVSSLWSVLARGAEPDTGAEQAELAVMRGDRALADQIASEGARLSERFSLRPYIAEGDLVRIEIALQLGARIREDDIDVAVIGSQLHLLRRLADADDSLPPRAWSPRRHPTADPAARLLLRQIRADKRAERRV